jgi:hypothetical protein
MKKLIALWKATQGLKTGAGTLTTIIPMLLIQLGIIEPSQQANAVSAVGGIVALIGLIDRFAVKVRAGK